MANRIRTGNHRGFNKGRSSKFRKGSRVRQTPEEGRRTYRPKRCGNNNKDEDNSPKNLNDKNSTLKSYILPWYLTFRFATPFGIMTPPELLRNFRIVLFLEYGSKSNCLLLIRVDEHSVSISISHWTPFNSS